MQVPNFRWSWCIVLALAASAHGQTLHFGTNRVAPGQIVEFAAPPNEAARREASKIGRTAGSIRCAFILPPGCTNLVRPFPLLIFSVPSGAGAIRQMRSMTNAAALEGYIIFAADGPKVDLGLDTIQWGAAMVASGLDQLTRTWPPVRQWPIACAGFSGGAKRSAAEAAALTRDNWRVVGVFMGGCNEDMATLGARLFEPGSHFKSVPMFLSNGEADPIANPQQGAAVKESMTRAGFTNVRLQTHEGKHELRQEHLRQALQWFAQTGGLSGGSR